MGLLIWFVYETPNCNFVPVQAIPEWVYSGFQSEWNSRFGTKFHSGILQTEDEMDWKSHLSCSLGRLVNAYLMRSGTSCCVGNLIQPIRSTTQIRVVTRHQYGISALVSETSFRGETSGGIPKCRLFSQAKVQYISVTFLNRPCTTTGREVFYFRIRCRTLKRKRRISRFLFSPWLRAM